MVAAAPRVVLANVHLRGFGGVGFGGGLGGLGGLGATLGWPTGSTTLIGWGNPTGLREYVGRSGGTSGGSGGGFGRGFGGGGVHPAARRLGSRHRCS